MKTTAYLLGLVAVVTLLALNLTESVRIRKALCGEYVTFHSSLYLPASNDAEVWKKTRAEMEANERQGLRYVGSHQEGGHTFLDYVRISRTAEVLSYDDAKALVELRMKQ